MEDPRKKLEDVFFERLKAQGQKLASDKAARRPTLTDSLELVQNALKPYHIDKNPGHIPDDVLAPHFKEIAAGRLMVSLLEWFLREVRSHQHLITAEINEFMVGYEVNGDVDVINSMLQRVLKWWEGWGQYVTHFNPYLDGSQSYRRICTVHLNATLPTTFRGAFRALLTSTLPPSESNNDEIRVVVVVHHRTSTIIATLNSLGLLTDHEHLVGSTLRDFITDHLIEICSGEWTKPCWTPLKDWYGAAVVPWIELVYVRSWMKQSETRAIFDPLNAKYQWLMCEALAKLRISEIFDIIVDYPASSAAVSDLKECLFQTGKRNELVHTLRTSNKKRLLHPGADTKDIITQYVSTIRCLRVLDPMGSLLFSVADPIRQYLRERPDTIRTIVQNLIDPKSEFTTGEDGDVRPLQDTTHLADDYGDFGWMPEPAYADAAFRTTRRTDIISTLVSIYDSREVFVKELQTLLAKRLLEIKNQDYDAEIRNIEILKLRFGDAPLQVCDVMMKDITDSRRADQHIKNARKAEMVGSEEEEAQKDGKDTKTLPIHATIISRLFWPSMPSTSLAMPPKFRKYQEEYAKRFSDFKPDRKIRFISNLGTVTLELELSDRTLSVEVTPLQAAMIDLFSERDTWDADELAVKLGNVDIPSVDKALEFWMDQGVIKSLGNKQYKVLEIAEEKKTTAMRPPRRSSLNEAPAVNKAEEQQAEQMRVYWQFIQGMLKNFGSLPTDRIHTMLKFAPNYDRTREQLATFMEALKREGMVDFRDGNWRLMQAKENV